MRNFHSGAGLFFRCDLISKKPGFRFSAATSENPEKHKAPITPLSVRCGAFPSFFLCLDAVKLHHQLRDLG